MIFVCGFISAQDLNIVSYLKDIEAGKAEEIREKLPSLQKENPGSVNIRFLQAVLTENGDEALTRYEQFYIQHPEKPYADAALYRVFSYYYSLGIYNKASEYLSKLKKEYPASPYIAFADRKIPDEIEDNGPEQKQVYTPPPPPPPVVKESEPVFEQRAAYAASKYTVQAGAFLNAANAGDLVKKIEKDGYPCEIFQKNVGGSLLNVVTVGNLKTEEEGDVIIQYLLARHKLKGRVVEK